MVIVHLSIRGTIKLLNIISYLSIINNSIDTVPMATNFKTAICIKTSELYNSLNIYPKFKILFLLDYIYCVPSRYC